MLLVVLAIAVAYSNAATCGFVLDDYHYILEHRDLGVAAIPRLFWHGYASGNAVFFRPLSTADFALDRSLFGLSATAFHVHNLLWHAAATLALYALADRAFGRRVAFAAALVFAVHPIHTEAVTGVVGRSELMAAAFVLAGCRLYLDGRRGWAAAACLLALLSKESGIVLPALAVLLDARDRRLRDAVRRAWPFAVPLAVYGLLRVHALAGSTLPAPAEYFVGTTRWQQLVTAVDVLGRDLRLLVWPHPLSADYSYPALPIASAAGAAIAIASFAALAVLARFFRSVRTALAWFLVAIFPVSNLVVHIGVLLAERLLYLASVSICLVAGAAYAWLCERRSPAIARAALLAVTLGFVALTLARNTDWQTPLSLWRDTVDKQPQSALAHANLAASCAVVGDDPCVRDHLTRAVALDPRRADFRAALDQVLSRGSR